MNRREAIAALVSLPAVKEVSRCAVTAKDVIVIDCDKPISQYEAAEIKRTLQPIWPDNQIVVFCAGMSMRVARV